VAYLEVPSQQLLEGSKKEIVTLRSVGVLYHESGLTLTKEHWKQSASEIIGPRNGGIIQYTTVKN
jgi:hypothetical protein